MTFLGIVELPEIIENASDLKLVVQEKMTLIYRGKKEKEVRCDCIGSVAKEYALNMTRFAYGNNLEARYKGRREREEVTSSLRVYLKEVDVFKNRMIDMHPLKEKPSEECRACLGRGWFTPRNDSFSIFNIKRHEITTISEFGSTTATCGELGFVYVNLNLVPDFLLPQFLITKEGILYDGENQANEIITYMEYLRSQESKSCVFVLGGV